MSQGLAQYESTVAGFGNAADSIRSFTATYDTDFFRDWTETHNLAMEKLKAVGDVSGGIGGAYIAGKLAYQKIQKLRGKKDDDDDDDEDDEDEKNTDDHDGDEDGGNDAEDGQVGEEAETEAGVGEEAAADVGTDVGVDAGSASSAAAGLPSGSGGAVGDYIGRGALGTDESADTSALGASEQPLSAGSASQFTQEAVADPLGAEPAAPAPLATPASETESGLGEEPDLLSSRAQAEQGTGYEPPEEFNPSPQTGELTSSTGESTVAEGTESTLETGTSTAEVSGAASSAAEGATAGSEILDTALTIGSGVAEAIPFLGIFAGIGIGLYELFHHPKKAPSAPPTSTASSKGEMVLPSFDSVTDTPASSSAF